MEEHVAERLLTHGNTLAVSASYMLDLIASGREFPAEEIRKKAAEMAAWAADVRAVASEERP